MEQENQWRLRFKRENVDIHLHYITWDSRNYLKPNKNILLLISFLLSAISLVANPPLEDAAVIRAR
jgi:hypothetical protein